MPVSITFDYAGTYSVNPDKPVVDVRAPAWAAAIGVLCSTLCLAAPAAAQSAEDPPPDPEGVDVRLRGGVSGGVGMLAVLAQTGTVYQPSFHLSGRIGVQIGSVFSLYYQNMPTVVVLTDGSGTILLDYNSFLADCTIANIVGLGIGPSADVVVLTGSNVSATKVLPGLHTRLAFYFSGKPESQDGRRKSLSLGIDMHPTFGPGGTFLTLQGGLGYEWY
jgi:hypothetical protein